MNRHSHPRKPSMRSRGAIPEPATPVPVMRAIKPRLYGTTKQVVGEAFRQAGGAAEVAVLFDLGESQVYGFTDPDARGSDLSLHRARQLAHVKQVITFAEDFAAIAGGVFLSPATVKGGEGLADIGADISTRTADVVSDLLRAIQDGNLSEQECAELRQSTDLAVATLIALRGRLIERCPP